MMPLYRVFHVGNSVKRFVERIVTVQFRVKVTAHNLSTKLRYMGLVLNEWKSRKIHVRTEGKLEDISTRLEASPK
jgi:hypothetical protein